MTQFAYLFKADPKANNNKYYEMKDNGDGTFTASYGRQGANPQTRTYPIHQWDKKYKEKLSRTKGYKDITHTKQTTTTTTSKQEYKEIEHPEISSLFDKLMSQSKMQIASNYTITTASVTQHQINESQRLIDELAWLPSGFNGNKQETINERLVELFHIMPRKMKQVREYLWQDTDRNSLAKIITREQDLLDTMSTQVGIVHSHDEGEDIDSEHTLLDFLGVTVEHVTDNNIIHTVQDMMDHDRYKLKRLFKVNDSIMDEKLKQHLTTTSNHQQQLLWHGSRTENILSILHKSLMIRPSNAQKQGDAFGKGNYFARKYAKSENYTSIYRSFHAQGSDDIAYIFLFNVHVGLQKIVHTGDSSLCYDGIRHQGYDSVWAKAGQRLLNDEYIVYNPQQSTVRFLLEISS